MSEVITKIEDAVEDCRKKINEIVSKMDPNSAAYFLKLFEEKIKEINEQTTNLQKDSGSSR
jgi:phage shock protein A